MTTSLTFALLMMLQLAACAADTGAGTPEQGDQAEETPLREVEPAEAGSPEATPAPVEETPAAVQPTAEPTETLEPATDRPGETSPPGERVPPTEAPVQPATGEVPEALLLAMVDDLAGRLNVDAAAIQVFEAAAVVWPDGSLGCPQPGQNYTMALVDGYRVVLASGEDEYLYHASQSGYFLLCEKALPQPPPDGTPTS